MLRHGDIRAALDALAGDAAKIEELRKQLPPENSGEVSPTKRDPADGAEFLHLEEGKWKIPLSEIKPGLIVETERLGTDPALEEYEIRSAPYIHETGTWYVRARLSKPGSEMVIPLYELGIIPSIQKGQAHRRFVGVRRKNGEEPNPELSQEWRAGDITKERIHPGYILEVRNIHTGEYTSYEILDEPTQDKHAVWWVRVKNLSVPLILKSIPLTRSLGWLGVIPQPLDANNSGNRPSRLYKKAQE